MNREKKPNSFFRQGLARRTSATRTTMYDLIRTLLDIVEEEEAEFIPQIILHMADTGMLRVGGAAAFSRLHRGMSPVRQING
jgi:hypothetical protein